MNPDRIPQTVHALERSLPDPDCHPSDAGTIFRLAAEEMSPLSILIPLAAVLLLDAVLFPLLSSPLLLIFCSAPLPLLLLFGRYVLQATPAIRELELTLPCCYGSMVCARAAILCACCALLLLPLALLGHRVGRESVLRLLLCGILPDLTFSTLLLSLSVRVRHLQDLALTAAVLWIAALFLLTAGVPLERLLSLCSTGLYALLALAALVSYLLRSRSLWHLHRCPAGLAGQGAS